MKVFNRIVVVIGILLGLAGSLFVLLYPIQAAEAAQAVVAQFEEALFDARFQTLFIVTMVVLIALLLFLLVLELRRGRRKFVRIRTEGPAKAVLGVDSIEQSLEFRIDELAGVRKVVPHVRSRGKDVEVSVDLDTSPSVNIPVLTDQVVNLCRDIVEGQLGVKLHGKIMINVHHEPYPRGTMPPTQPLPKGAEAIATQPRFVEPQPAPRPEPAPAREAALPKPPVQAKAVAQEKPAPAPVAPAPDVTEEAEATKEPWFRRHHAEPAPAAPEPKIEMPAEPEREATVAATPPSQPGPRPLGDLAPLTDLTETAAPPAQAPAGEEDDLDDLDLYDPTARDE
ncbi:MAG: alkaline shock response membrane anchor protein AmaP [Anaerolineales bacterium]